MTRRSGLTFTQTMNLTFGFAARYAIRFKGFMIMRQSTFNGI